MIDPDSVVRVSPSTVEGVLRCGLRWLLERHGGSEPATAKQGIGNLVHDAATKAAIAGTTAEELRQHVLTHFEKIEMPAVWLGQRERERATAMVDKLVAWLTANPRRLIDVERAFRSELAQTTDSGTALSSTAASTGSSRTNRVDSSSSTSRPAGARPARRTPPSMRSSRPTRSRSRPARFPRDGRRWGRDRGVGHASGDAVVREQPPLAQTDDPRWAEALVLRAASAMAASTVAAVVNDSCGYCAVRTSCPVSGKGRQVTDE